MPNYCSNTLEFYCEPHEVMPLRLEVQNGSRQLDFNRVLPCPDELSAQPPPSILEQEAWQLKHGPYGQLSPDHHELLAAARAGAGRWATLPSFDQVADRLEQLHATHGAISESDWKVKHWGTRGNALDHQHFCLAGPASGEPSTWYFETVWSPPRPLIRALSSKFPHIPMRLVSREDHTWLDERTCFHGGVEVPAANLPVPMALMTWLITK
jgi:hypothetical protein